MDGGETPISYQNDSQPAGSSSGMGTLDVQRPLYTVPGILHHLQHEWTRFEIDRQQWETERAELQVKERRRFAAVRSLVSLRRASPFSRANGKDKRI